jgi:hypothetical protein
LPALRGGLTSLWRRQRHPQERRISDTWPVRTMILLLALGSLALVLAAVTRVNGAAAAASVRARLGSRGLSRGSARRRGIRYRE